MFAKICTCENFFLYTSIHGMKATMANAQFKMCNHLHLPMNACTNLYTKFVVGALGTVKYLVSQGWLLGNIPIKGT